MLRVLRNKAAARVQAQWLTLISLFVLWGRGVGSVLAMVPKARGAPLQFSSRIRTIMVQPVQVDCVAQSRLEY